MEKETEKKVVGLMVIDASHMHFTAAIEHICEELENLGIKVVPICPSEIGGEIFPGGEVFTKCSGYVYVGAYKFFSSFVEVVKHHTKGVRKVVGIFEGSGGSCKNFVDSFRDTSGVFVCSDFRPGGLAQKITAALT